MRLIGIGDNVIDRYIDLDRGFPGGNPLNVAVAARRAGCESAYLGALGTDAAGTAILEALRAEGVEVDRVRIVEGRNAYDVVNLVDGDRVFLKIDSDQEVLGGEVFVGVSRFQLDADDLGYAATFDLIHTGCYSMLEDQIGYLASAGPPVSFDFSNRREPGYVEPILPHLAFASFSASDLSEGEALDLLAQAVANGPEFALATRGEEGALLHDGRRTWRQPILERAIVDTLGAGDSFIARVLVGVFGKEDPPTALAAAAEAAATTCTYYGAFGHGRPLAIVAPDIGPSDVRR
jgi:sugar/nucleoside kinase (ribokinase family)